MPARFLDSLPTVFAKQAVEIACVETWKERNRLCGVWIDGVEFTNRIKVETRLGVDAVR